MRITILGSLLLLTLVGMTAHHFRLKHQISSTKASIAKLDSRLSQAPPNLERAIEILQLAAETPNPLHEFDELVISEYEKEIASREIPVDFNSDRAVVSAIVDHRNTQPWFRPTGGTFHFFIPHDQKWQIEIERWCTLTPEEIAALSMPVEELISMSESLCIPLQGGVSKLTVEREMDLKTRISNLKFTLNGNRVAAIDYTTPGVIKLKDYELKLNDVSDYVPNWKRRTINPSSGRTYLGCCVLERSRPDHHRECGKFIGLRYWIRKAETDVK